MKKIIEFQKENGLTPDGKIGKKTLATINAKIGNVTNEQLANFMGQVDHETGVFQMDTENLNYSVKGLRKTFGKYFKTDEEAALYAKNPKKIANKVYANRMGNGDEASNEGFSFIGRGALQLTGKNNYKEFSKIVGEDCVVTPTLVATKFFFESAKFYFDNNKLWNIASKVDDDNIIKLSKGINLGNVNSKKTPNGLDDRIAKTKKYYEILTKK